jgi:hypothetical protein
MDSPRSPPAETPRNLRSTRRARRLVGSPGTRAEFEDTPGGGFATHCRWCGARYKGGAQCACELESSPPSLVEREPPEDVAPEKLETLKRGAHAISGEEPWSTRTWRHFSAPRVRSPRVHPIVHALLPPPSQRDDISPTAPFTASG